MLISGSFREAVIFTACIAARRVGKTKSPGVQRPRHAVHAAARGYADTMSAKTSADGSSLALFSAELLAARQARGLTQEELGARIVYSASTVAMIERRERVPSLDFARRCDEVLGLPGTLVRMHEAARSEPLPSWFRPFADVEAVAAQLRLWEHAVVPGLLQTEDYARAMLAAKSNITPGELDELVTARMARQDVLSREGGPPLIWALIDEGVLLREVGGPKVMYGQCMHLLQMSAQPRITLQVVPLNAGAHEGMSGAFAVADVDNASGIAYLETVADGYIAESADVVRRVSVTFDTLRSLALPVGASRELIMKRAEQYGLE